MATPVANSIPLSGDPLKDPLLQGSSWTFSGAHVLTYSFNLNFDIVEGQVVSAPGGSWNITQKAAFTAALTAWSNVANLTFTELPAENNKYVFASAADIATALTGSDLQNSFGAAALGFFPDPAFATGAITGAGYSRSQYPQPEGDVLFDNFYSGFASLNAGSFGLWTMIHELGHALGLKHSFDDGANNRPTFAGIGLPLYENERYTVMSYSGIANATAFGHAATPMSLDILAIQHIYGANTAFRSGDDTYTVAPDGSMRTLWDAGGNDTLVVGAVAAGVTLDLRPGALMDLGGGSVLGLAYNPAGSGADATIENAIGGIGSDTLYGNDAANTLTGNAGSNTYYGGKGDDTYIVSSSTDTVVENLGEGDDTMLASVSFSASGMFSLETITLTGNANIDASAGMGTLRINGNAGNNVLTSAVGGSDPETLAGGAGNDTYVINSPGITVQEAAGQGDDEVRIAVLLDYTLPANVERLTLTSPSAAFLPVSLTGNALANLITGAGGNNTIDGAAGNDTLVGGGGNDSLEGGAGMDTAGYAGNRAAYSIAHAVTGGFNVNALAGGDGHDVVQSIEVLRFADSLTVIASQASDAGIVDNFRPLLYLASNPGLIGVFGADSDAALTHYLEWGFSEGRPVAAFNPDWYLASNPGLIGAFGADAVAATDHYVRWGFAEQRATQGFNPYAYLAANPGLIGVFGADAGAAIDHYIHWGYAEGRPVGGFNALSYLASNPGILGVLGLDVDAATEHYVRWGYSEGRLVNGFDGYEYLASNPVLIGVFGADPAAALIHYLHWGYAEGRPLASFDGLEYIASNPGLIPFLGASPAAAVGHYVVYGFSEGRPAASFDAQQYLVNYGDLEGKTLAEARLDFINGGHAEGRIDSALPATPGATSGADLISGSASSDLLSGSLGNDTLAGGLGNDSLIGGYGTDQFVFDTLPDAANNFDRVVDFTPGVDQLVLDHLVFTQLVAGNLNAAQLVAAAGAVAADNNDLILYDSATGTLSYDADGNGAGAAVAFATLASHPVISAADFAIV